MLNLVNQRLMSNELSKTISILWNLLFVQRCKYNSTPLETLHFLSGQWDSLGNLCVCLAYCCSDAATLMVALFISICWQMGCLPLLGNLDTISIGLPSLLLHKKMPLPCFPFCFSVNVLCSLSSKFFHVPHPLEPDFLQS